MPRGARSSRVPQPLRPDAADWTLMTKFSDLKLDARVLQAISEAGYETPTPIQAGAIPPALEGKDVLGIAQTGTGKTASFTLPMITLLSNGRARARMPRSLVLAPTRELAAQVAENFDIYAKHTKLSKALLIGGVSFGEQDKLIDRGVDVLIATPGRLLDHFERGKLLLTGVQIMVVDEADRMLDMGFIPDIERIFQLTPFTRQTLFFSATMAPEIERITNTFLHTPVKIEVARQATTSETIEQRLVQITPARKDQTAKAKRELLRAVIKAEGEACTNAILFCNRKTEVDILAKSLKTHGFDAAPIHGDLDQSQAHQDAGRFPRWQAALPRRLGCGGAGAGHSRRQPCVQLRPADPCRGLCPPDRSHGTRGTQRHGDFDRDARGPEISRPDRGAGEKAHSARRVARGLCPVGRRAKAAPPGRRPQGRPPAARQGARGTPRATGQGTWARGSDGCPARGRADCRGGTWKPGPSHVASVRARTAGTNARTSAGDRPRDDRRSSDRRDRYDRDERSLVVGMGDHVPDFLMRGLVRVETPADE